MPKSKELEAIRKLEDELTVANEALAVVKADRKRLRQELQEALELARKAADLAREIQDQSDSYRSGINALGEDIASAIIQAYLATTTEETSQSSH